MQNMRDPRLLRLPDFILPRELLAQIQEMGVKIAHVTLHVGLGTFRPVKVSNVLDHHMHSEFYRIEEDAANMINETKKNWRTHHLCRYDKLPDD